MRLAPSPPRRRLVSLTPLIDVVFLILVFFMLASKFSTERTLPLSAAGQGGGAWQGAPRLIEIAPERLSLNGAPVALDGLAAALASRGIAGEAALVLRPVAGADTQRLTDVLDALRAAGHVNAVLVP